MYHEVWGPHDGCAEFMSEPEVIPVPDPHGEYCQECGSPRGEGHDASCGACHDCAAGIGQYHSEHCDVPICPRCGEQFFLCEHTLADVGHLLEPWQGRSGWPVYGPWPTYQPS